MRNAGMRSEGMRSADDALAELGPAARSYATTAGEVAAVGGPRAMALSAAITSALAARGNRAQPDRALTMVAGVLLRRAARGGAASAVDVERIARHVGFAGSILSASAFPLDGAAGTQDGLPWRQAIAEIAPNLPVTRYGLVVSEAADAAAGGGAVVFGDVSVALEPLPRRLPQGGRLALRGELGARFQFGHLYVTRPDGTVRETPIASRRIEATVLFDSPGVYRVEIMGDGAATGPSIVMNVPIAVGMPDTERAQPVAPQGSSDSMAPAQFEARSLDLVNRARAQAGLGPLAADRELRAIAVAHSQDMERTRFFGHVSPTTGTLVERLQRAGVEVAIAGENLSQASTPEESHQGLMDSPGHRANMLGAKFTHVGIGVVRAAGTPARFLATLVFARRTPVGQVWTAADVERAIAALRASRRLPPVAIDPLLRAAAEVGMNRFAQVPLPAEAAGAASTAFGREAARRGGARRTVCAHFFEILDPEQLASIAALTDPRLRRIGLAVGARTEAGTRKLATLMLAEGGGCDGG